MNPVKSFRSLNAIVIGAALLLALPMFAQSDKTLAPNTRFFTPPPDQGAVQQAFSLIRSGQVKNALLIAAMEVAPRAVWVTGGLPRKCVPRSGKRCRKRKCNERCLYSFCITSRIATAEAIPPGGRKTRPLTKPGSMPWRVLSATIRS